MPVNSLEVEIVRAVLDIAGAVARAVEGGASSESALQAAESEARKRANEIAFERAADAVAQSKV